MTELLYYHDSYQVDFRARITERVDYDGRSGLVLDRTLFYPTSGGQPFDRGLIDDIPVEEVLIRDEDDKVIHLLSTLPAGDEVRGNIDWARRFDHMQQHTGQHILSQAFERIAGASTVGFHMSADSSTVDLDVARLDDQQLSEAEYLANSIVWQNRAVSVSFVPVSEALKMPLRKLPPAKNGLLRLVSVDSFDLSACGGTHVRQTGEVGLIKVVKTERQSGKFRVEFLCGGRALADYGRKDLVLSRLSGDLTTGYWELENAVARLREDLKSANRSLKRKTDQLIQYEAAELAGQAAEIGGVRVICQGFIRRDPAELRKLAGHLASAGNTIVLLGLAGEKSLLLFARSDDVPLPVNEILAQALPLLGDATGGGSSNFAQGGGPAAGQSQIDQVLSAAQSLVRDALAPTA